jgi:ABC-type multidrug transport system ATPase subunit
MPVPLSPGGQKIEARGLTKQYGAKRAVDDLSFDVNPGLVTGFIGPNGAGKTTTMRLILGLDHPTRGGVTVGGMPYRQLPAPMHEVGALLDPRAVHPSRTAYHHLLTLAHSNGIPLAGSARCSGSSAWRMLRHAGWGASPSAWASAWGSLPPCWGTRRC